MELQKQIACDLRKCYFGGNWTAVSLKPQIEGLDWKTATSQVFGLNSIATLAFHMNYYIGANIKALEGGSLDVKDELSFAHPRIENQKDWDNFISRIYQEVEHFASLIESMQEEQLWENFTDKKNASYYRNFQGIIEHCHYHIGQIVILKKIFAKQNS